MARLIILSEAQMGRSHELQAGTTTIGRVEDNVFPIAEPSVSSHHCEVMLRANELLVRDLNSTNGTFINGQQVTGEAVVKPGQTLRLGQIELRFEGESAAAPAVAETKPAPAAIAAAPAAAPSSKKHLDQAMITPQGVKLGQVQGQGTAGGLGHTGFSKKSNTGTKIFIGAAVVLGIVVIAFILYYVLQSGQVGTQ